jgi:hypothetical protein
MSKEFFLIDIGLDRILKEDDNYLLDKKRKLHIRKIISMFT